MNKFKNLQIDAKLQAELFRHVNRAGKLDANIDDMQRELNAIYDLLWYAETINKVK